MGKPFINPPWRLAEWVPGKPTSSPRADFGLRKAWRFSGSTFRVASDMWEAPKTNIGQRYTPMTAI
jgi:hypothetical protein